MSAEIKSINGEEAPDNAHRTDLLTTVANKIDSVPGAHSVVVVVLSDTGMISGWHIHPSMPVIAALGTSLAMLQRDITNPDQD